MHKNQLWDDTLMMSVIPLTRIGILLDRPHYIQEALYQFLLHIQYLVDTDTGLWYHGWEFTPSNPKSKGNNFAKALWARGNCWITVSIPIFLEVMGERLPENDPIRKFLISTYRRQIDALIPLQDKKSGLWHTLLVDPSSYVETSASAGFAAGILAGIRMVGLYQLRLNMILTLRA
jgi:unsaturated rhamnogalacturonyl hydrolase